MTIDQQKSENGHHADRSAWVIWGVLVLIAVAILPFAVRNSEIVRQIAAMCGFTIGWITSLCGRGNNTQQIMRYCHLSGLSIG
ncbi:MAG: hypothetical protein O3C30_06270 [Proteobacteria bacterium]|nr:hypothetical protein [Pseudomonadota bacterium]